MIETSDEFKEAVYAPARRTKARVTFDISDVTAADDATADASSQASISRLAQTHNQKRDRPAYALFEPDYWRLDGSFVLPPKPTEPGFEVGWYSDQFVDETAQWLHFTFTEPHSSIGLSITFDVPADEYAVDFGIMAIGGDQVIISKDIRDNTDALYVLEEPITGYTEIVIVVSKWSKPNRRAKITEVSFGVVREYADDSLIKVNLLEEIIPTSATVPANELKFVVDNSSKEFNILNPDGFYKYLQERQSAVVEIGVETTPNVYEYVNMGYYYLTDWQSDEGSLTTTFTARNRIDFIPAVEIENLTTQSTNLYALCLSIIQQSGVKNYRIDPALQSITTSGIYKKMTYRQLLQNIAVAGQCVMFVGRDDFLNITRLQQTEAVDNITFDNVYKEPQIKLDKLISRVEVNYYSGQDVAGTQVLTTPAEGGSTLKVDNTLINSQAHAQDVAQWLLDQSNIRGLFDINWRQNPSLECGDTVAVEDSYGVHSESMIIRQEFEYQGYLAGKTKSKGAV